MTKLIAKFRANPTNENALKLALYALKHPMAECMLPLGDHATVVQAKAQAGK